jgi:hypothetical protein
MPARYDRAAAARVLAEVAGAAASRRMDGFG